MKTLGARLSKIALGFTIVALPAVLLFSSLRTFHELDLQKSVYLRSRAAAIAARLETQPVLDMEAFDDEPGLVNLRVYDRSSAPTELDSIWLGGELFRTERLANNGQPILRAQVPFHHASEVRIAQIDLAEESADFLVEHARHNILFASIGGFALVLLSLYAIWSSRRHAAMRQRQMELEHLAHIGEMSAALAHEIRNPLGTIKGFAQLISERKDDGVRALTDPILSETARLENLVKDLLLYGRPPQVHIRPVVWTALEAVLEAHARAAIGERAIQFVPSGRELEFDSDSALLEQALLNLIRNAIEAIPDGLSGSVYLAVSHRTGLRIEVRDTGPGLSGQASAHLYEPFYTTKASGTGLGLSITRRLVQSLGGTLTLSSADPHGTTATLYFPHIQPEERPPVVNAYGKDTGR